MQKINKKKIIFISVFLIVIILIIFLVRSCTSTTKLKYEYKSASHGQVKKTISVTGVLEVMNSETILSKIRGVVNNVYADYNQKIKKGQILATLNTTGIDQKLQKSRNQLETSKLELHSAERELKGKRSMYKDNLISKQAMEQAEIKYKSVFYRKKEIQIDYQQLVREKSYTRITSPISGIVIARNIDPKISVNITKPLFLIAPDLKKMLLVISIDEADIGNIKKGQDVIFSVSAFPEKDFHGKISQVRINPIYKGEIVTYQSLVICNNDELILKPGMTATATVIVAKKKNVLRVLNQAFIISPEDIEYEPGKKYLWRKTEKKTIGETTVERVEVKTGLAGDMYTEVLENILKGEKILINIRETK